MPQSNVIGDEGYDYTPLVQDNSIRVLMLQPGQPHDPLVCSLQPGRLDEIPSYEAISYVWGSSSRGHEITCDGKKLYITRNLDSALRGLRLPSKPRTLWADSICINQEDLSEKNIQVALMGEIYCRCSSALIFLGQDLDGHADSAAALVGDVCEMMRVVMAKVDGSPDSFPYPGENDSLVRDRRWRSVTILLEQPWFSRGWVVQEAGLSPNSRLIWGRAEISWVNLIRAYNWLAMRAPRAFVEFGLKLSPLHFSAYIQHHFQEACSLYPLEGLLVDGILDNLHYARQLELYDARDRIFAFLALPRLADEKALSIRPNYLESEADVYLGFATEYISVVKNFDILPMVQHTEESIMNVAAPSWVPNWNTGDFQWLIGDTRKERLGSIAGSIDFIPMLLSPGVLEVQAVVLDKIKCVSEFIRKDASIADVTAAWVKFSKNNVPGPYSSRVRSLAFVEAFTAGQFEGSWESWQAHQSAFRAHIEAASREEHSKGPKEPSDDALKENELGDLDTVLDFGRERARNRCFFMTQRGYFGLGPLVAHEGDVCCIMFGARIPFVLRPMAGMAGHYRLLGEAWITGKEVIPWDDGEYMVILGDEKSKDWIDWGLAEESIKLC